MSLTDKVPDASTLSQNRHRRFNELDIYQQIFDEIVLQAIARKLVSGKHLFTDVHVTPGNVHDSVPYLKHVDRQREQFNLPVEAVGLDAGYFTAALCQGLEARQFYGVIGYRRPAHR